MGPRWSQKSSWVYTLHTGTVDGSADRGGNDMVTSSMGEQTRCGVKYDVSHCASGTTISTLDVHPWSVWNAIEGFGLCVWCQWETPAVPATPLCERNHIPTKPSAGVGAPAVACLRVRRPRGGDARDQRRVDGLYKYVYNSCCIFVYNKSSNYLYKYLYT